MQNFHVYIYINKMEKHKTKRFKAAITTKITENGDI